MKLCQSLFEQVVEKIRRLPNDQQDEAAELLLSIIDQDPDRVRLSAEQRAKVARRLQDSALTYATDEEGEELYRKLDA